MPKGIPRDKPVFDSSKDIFDEDTLKGLYPELGREMRRLMRIGTPAELSARDGAKKSGVSYSTIYALLEGSRVDYGLLLKVALAFDTDLNKVLKLGGYSPLCFSPSTIQKAAGFLPPGYKITLDEQSSENMLDVALKEKVDKLVSQFPTEIQSELRERYYRQAAELIEKEAAWDKIKKRVPDTDISASHNMEVG